MTLRQPLRIRITIEYDPDWSDAVAPEEVLAGERDDWFGSNITIEDVQAEGGTVKFEVIP